MPPSTTGICSSAGSGTPCGISTVSPSSDGGSSAGAGVAEPAGSEAPSVGSPASLADGDGDGEGADSAGGVATAVGEPASVGEELGEGDGVDVPGRSQNRKPSQQGPSVATGPAARGAAASASESATAVDRCAPPSDATGSLAPIHETTTMPPTTPSTVPTTRPPAFTATTAYTDRTSAMTP